MDKFLTRIAAFLIIPALLSDPLSAAVMPWHCAARVLQTTSTLVTQKFQYQAISPPACAVRLDAIGMHRRLQSLLGEFQDGRSETGVNLERPLDRFADHGERLNLAARLTSHQGIHRVPGLLNWDGDQFTEVHREEHTHSFLKEMPGGTALITVDAAPHVDGNRRKLVDRFTLRRLLGSKPGEDLGQRWYAVRDMATGQEYGRYPGWWILRHGLEISVPPPGVQVLRIEPLSDDLKPEWSQDVFQSNFLESAPLSSLRNSPDTDVGSGLFSNWPSYYESIQEEGFDVSLILPHYSTKGFSPYSPDSVWAVSQDQIDWSEVDEVKGDPVLLAESQAPGENQSRLNPAAHRRRQEMIAQQAADRFFASSPASRLHDWQGFVEENRFWLNDYADMMALDRILLLPGQDDRDQRSWTATDVERARAHPDYPRWVARYQYAQWIGYSQLQEAIRQIHAKGGKVFFDMPMFRGICSIDVLRHSEYFDRPNVPGINAGLNVNGAHYEWPDLARWNWTELEKDNFEFLLAPLRHWLKHFDGVRLDALHLAYPFEGNLTDMPPPGDRYVERIAAVLKEGHKYAVAEAFQKMPDGTPISDLVSRHGIQPVGNEQQPYNRISDHDDAPDKPRGTDRWADFMQRLIDRSLGAPVWMARMTAIVLGHRWRDTEYVKREVPIPMGTFAYWEYRVPHPSDPDYLKRVNFDTRHDLRGLKAYRHGHIWAEPYNIARRLAIAADEFVHEFSGVTQIFAAANPLNTSFEHVWQRPAWFQEEWGRDAFISLPGLLLTTGRYDQARDVIRHFARHIRNGVVPNRVWDEKHIEYNNVDGSLWFIQAVKATVEATGDKAFLQEMLPAIRQIIAFYQKPLNVAEGEPVARYDRNGTHRIYMDSDGLIVSPSQATWMDADPRMTGAVTPRNGKAVEINALWYSSLRFLAASEKSLGSLRPESDALADRVRASFNEKFWNSSEQALFDVIEGDPHGGAIRPNMIFAVSHAEDLLPPEREAAVVACVTRDLLTPFGLRTLSPRDSHYHGAYSTRDEDIVKDQAYHQGTVWPWLIGPYIDALWKVRRAVGIPADMVRAEIQEILTPLVEDLMTTVYGSIFELRRGDWPHQPEGPPAQAWSVAEVIRAATRYGVLDPEQMMQANSQNMVPARILVDPVVANGDGTFEVSARAYGRNGFLPRELVMQVSSHGNLLDDWGHPWTDEFGVRMDYVDQDPSDGAFRYKAIFHPGPGKHEGAVRCAAPERLGDWHYAEGGNLHFENLLAGIGNRAHFGDDNTAVRAVRHYLLDMDASELSKDLEGRVSDPHHGGLAAALETLADLTVWSELNPEEAVLKFREVASQALVDLMDRRPASADELFAFLGTLEPDDTVDQLWRWLVYSLTEPVASRDISMQLLLSTDERLERVRQSLLAMQSPPFQRRLLLLGRAVPMTAEQTPKGWPLHTGPGQARPAARGNEPVRHRLGTGGRPSRTLSIRVEQDSSLDVKGTGDAGVFPIGLDMYSSGERPSTWLRFSTPQTFALKELVNGLRLQEFSMTASEKPLAMCTPLQIVRPLQMRTGRLFLELADYFQQYLRNDEEMTEERAGVLRRLLSLATRRGISEFDSLPIPELVAMFLEHTPPVQLHSTMPQTDIRDINVGGLLPVDLLMRYREFYKAFGHTFQEFDITPTMTREQYADKAFEQNRNSVREVLQQTATQIGEVAGTAMGVGADLGSALAGSNLVGYAWAKDFETADLPARHEPSFNSNTAQNGVRRSLQDGEDSLRALVTFLGGDPSVAEEAVAHFHATVAQRFIEVQKKIIDDPKQSVLEPRYVEAFQAWRDRAEGVGIRFGYSRAARPGARPIPKPIPSRYVFGAVEGRGAIMGDAGRFVDGLSTSMAKARKPVTVIMPRYRDMKLDKPVLSTRELCLKFDLRGRTGEIILEVDEVEVESNLTYLLIRDPEGLFFQVPYQDSDGLRGFIESVLLSKAIVELAQDGDLVHTHGWQTALVHEYIDQERYRFLHTPTVATAERSLEKGIIPWAFLANPEDQDQARIIERLNRGGINKFRTYKGRPVVTTHPLLGLERSILTDYRRLEYQSTKDGKRTIPGQIALLKAVRAADRVGISRGDEGDIDFNAFLDGLGGSKRVDNLFWPATGRPNPGTREGLAFYDEKLYQSADQQMLKREPFQRLGSDASARFVADPQAVTYLQLPGKAFNVLYPGCSVFMTSAKDEWLIVIGRAVNYVISKDTFSEGTKVVSQYDDTKVQAPFLLFIQGLVADGTPVGGMVRGYWKKGLWHQIKQLFYHLELMNVEVKTVLVRGPDGELYPLPLQPLKDLEAFLLEQISTRFTAPENLPEGQFLPNPLHYVDVMLNMHTGQVEQTDRRPVASHPLPPIQMHSVAAAA